MSAFFKSLATKAAYLLAALIIFTAVVVTAVRYTTPLLDRHRVDFETLASDYLKTPVSIKRVRFSWFQYHPVIRLDQVKLLDKNTKQPILQIKKVNILISVPSTIWQRKVVTSGLLVSGSSLSVAKTAAGEWEVKELASLGLSQGTTDKEAAFKEVMGWLSQESRVILRDIDLHYQGKNNDSRFITLYDLSLYNESSSHEMTGKAILHQALPTEVSVSANWRGDSFDLKQIKANLYLYVSGLSLSQWARDFNYQSWHVKEGIASAKVWATWEKGQFQTLQSTLQFYSLQLLSDKNKQTPYVINRLSGNVGWKRQGQNQVLAGDEILIDLPGHLWPVTGFYLSLSQKQSGELIPLKASVGYVDLSDLQAFLLSSKMQLPDSIKRYLTQSKFLGGVQQASITFGQDWRDWQQLQADVTFDRVGMTAYQSVPGIQNISGQLAWNGTNGNLKVNASRAIVVLPTIFPDPLYVDQISGEVGVSRQPENVWAIKLANVQVLNSDVAGNVNGTITIPAKGSASTDLSANFTLQQAGNVARYLPLKIFDPALSDWLKQAFLTGEVQAGSAILRGRLSDFPFTKGDGEFKVTGNVRNVDLRFAPDWPLIENISGNIAFAGNGMEVNVDHAETLGVKTQGAKGVIENLSGDKTPAILRVTTQNFKTDFQHGMQYVHQSPLEKTLGNMFKDVELEGPVDLQLDLTVPLKNPDDTQVNGVLSMSDATMKLVPWHLSLTELNGGLKFTEKSADAANIKAILFNKPFAFNLQTTQSDKKTPIVQAKFNNALNIGDLEKWLNLPYKNIVSGTTNVMGTIDFSLTEPLAISVKSNLVGATVKLADQFAKLANEVRDFSADIFVQNNQPLKLKMQYGSLLNAALILNRKLDNYQIQAADVRFGSGVPDWPKAPGLYITGQFDKLDWATLQSYAGASGDGSTPSLPIKGIDVRANTVSLQTIALTNVRVQAVPQDKNWNVSINSSEVDGRVVVPMSLSRQSTITADLDKVYLDVDTTSTGKSAALFNVKTIPAIIVNAKDVTVNRMPLGKISVKTATSRNGLSIKELRVQSSRVDLRATGEWTQVGDAYRTRLQGGVTSPRVSALLTSLGMNASNFVASNGSSNFNVEWADAPYLPSTSTMSGKASLVLGEGRIVDIGKENGAKMDLGRMLSIFSLQTIPRRLALDFSDVFQKGYSFDSVRGDFTLKQGDLYTSNLRFDGPVAKIDIDGRIGLKNKDYNFILSVTAHVTSSIPVAATLLTGNPLIGIGAFAVNAMIGSQVSKATSNYYSVTGSWDNPVWKSVKSGK